MLTKEELSGTWNDIKGRVKQEWGNITDDDLKAVEGSIDRLVGLIQKKSGEARLEVEKTLRSLSEQSAGMLGSASQAVQGAAQAAQDYAHQYAGQATDMAKEQYTRAQDLVRQRPAESVIVSFGTGVLIGVVVGLLVRSK